MFEFYAQTREVQLLVTVLLALCVIAQTSAMVLSYFRRPASRLRILENITEVFVLMQIIVLSLLHGQVLHGYRLGLIAPAGYNELRYFTAFAVMFFSCAAAVMNAVVLRRSVCQKGPSPLTQSPLTHIILRFTAVIVFTSLTLPVVERVFINANDWLYMAALLFWILRGAFIFSLRYREIRTSISSISVKYTINALHTGVLFSEPDGFILLSNERMQRLMVIIAGRADRNAHRFYETLTSGKLQPGCRVTEFEGQVVCLLPDEEAWMFTRTPLSIRKKLYFQLTAADVTARWALTEQLRQQEELLKLRGEELRSAIANLNILSRERELQRAKIRAHDILGHRLTLLLSAIRNEHTLDFDLLRKQSRELLEDLKSNQSATSPQNKYDIMKQSFETIGVVINLDGELPEDDVKGYAVVDVIRECTANAVRHGFATGVFIKTGHPEGSFRMEITNNGHSPAQPIIEGGGIGGMRGKVEPLGGALNVTAHPHFALTVDLPEA